MRGIFKFFINNYRLVNLLVILVLLMGFLAFPNLKRSTFPDTDFKVLFINTVYPGAAPKDVEINVTIPIEEELMNVTGIKEMSSYSTENFSSIIVAIDPDAKDAQKVKDDVSKAVDRVSNLPKEVRQKPVIIELGSGIFPIFEVAISGDVPELELRKYATTLEKQLKQVAGVGTIQKLGYRKREMHIEVDLTRAEKSYIAISEVMNAVSASNIRLTGGSIQSVKTKKNVVTLAQFAHPMDVRDVIVRSAFSGRKVTVSDIATVRDDFEKKDVITRTDGINSINLVISKKEDADAVSTAQNIRKLITAYNETLPEQVRSEVVRDLSVYVSASLNNVVNNAALGFFLVILCLVLFLDPWSALFTAIGIPISLFATFYVMYMYDIPLTTISLLAIVLVLGMLVDNGIVISEYIFQLREKGKKPLEASLEGVSEIFRPVVATVTTTIAAFLPILLMGGIFGDWLSAIPILVTVLLISSLVSSVLILPSQLANAPLRIKAKPRFIIWLEERYRWSLKFVLRRKYRFIGLFIAALVASVLLMPLIGFELFPQTDNNVIQVRIEAPKGTPIEETGRRVEKLERIITEVIPGNELASFVTTVGEKVSEADDIYGVRQSHWARIVINLVPRERRKDSAFDLQKQLDSGFSSLKGSDFTVLETLVTTGGPPVGKPIDVSFIGSNDDVRKRLAGGLMDFLMNEPGVINLTRDDEAGPNEMIVKLNYGLMSELGITPFEVARSIRAAYDGEIVTSVRHEGEEIDFRVMASPNYKSDINRLSNLTITNRMGKLIRLGSILRFEEGESPLAVRRQDGDGSIKIRGEVDRKKGDPAKINARIKEAFSTVVAEHPEMRMKFGGLERSTLESLTNFFNAFIIAVFAIFIILVVLFNSLSQPLIVMFAIPFGLIGVVLAFLIHMTPVTFLGLIGILGLSGVVVNNSLVMLSFLNELEVKICGKGEELKIEDVAEISASRLRPIFLTTITTVAGLLPSVYGFFGGRVDELFPLLLAITYGLIFSTLITLFLIPAIYLAERDFGCWFYARLKRRESIS